jgi:hypothetical protein
VSAIKFVLAVGNLERVVIVSGLLQASKRAEYHTDEGRVRVVV